MPCATHRFSAFAVDMALAWRWRIEARDEAIDDGIRSGRFGRLSGLDIVWLVVQRDGRSSSTLIYRTLQAKKVPVSLLWGHPTQ